MATVALAPESTGRMMARWKSGPCATPIPNRTFATPYVSMPFLSHARSVTNGLPFVVHRRSRDHDSLPLAWTSATSESVTVATSVGRGSSVLVLTPRQNASYP